MKIFEKLVNFYKNLKLKRKMNQKIKKLKKKDPYIYK